MCVRGNVYGTCSRAINNIFANITYFSVSYRSWFSLLRLFSLFECKFRKGHGSNAQREKLRESLIYTAVQDFFVRFVLLWSASVCTLGNLNLQEGTKGKICKTHERKGILKVAKKPTKPTRLSKANNVVQL